MRIRKVAESVGILGKILNSKSNSKQDTYSADYINNNFLGGGDGDYSTSEINTGRKWVDGKPIYQRVVRFNTYEPILTGINFDTIVFARCMVKQSTNQDNCWRNIPWCYNDSNHINDWYGGYYIWNDGKIAFQLGTSLRDIERGHIILEYTKQND